MFTPIHGGGGEGMEMLVRGASAKKEGGLVEMAEVATMRRDVLFGTLRAGIRFAEERGTCGAWFWVSLSRVIFVCNETQGEKESSREDEPPACFRTITSMRWSWIWRMLQAYSSD